MSRSQLGFKPEADDSDSGVLIIETGIRALGPEDRPGGSGDETQSHAWALGTAAFAGPGESGRPSALELPKGCGRAECGLLEAEGKRGLQRSKLWPASH